MPISARIRLSGKITDIYHDRSHAHVMVEISKDISIEAMIQASAAEALKLKPGMKAETIIKASNVIIGVDEDTDKKE